MGLIVVLSFCVVLLFTPIGMQICNFALIVSRVVLLFYSHWREGLLFCSDCESFCYFIPI